MSGGGAKNDYWPGFVDALTNVVIAMVFVIVVLAIALSFSAQLLAQRLAAKIAEQENQLGKARAALQGRPADVEKPAAPRAPGAMAVDAQVATRTRIAVAGNEAAASAAAAVVKPAERYLQLDFAAGALTLDPAAAEALTQALAPVQQRLAEQPGARVSVVALGPDLHLSENQRSAFIRAMAVRNHLLSQGIAGDRIATRIDTQSRTATPAVAVRVEDTP